MSDTRWITEMFEAIDAKDTESFVSYLTETGVFRFGNLPAVAGRAAVGEFVGDFFTSIAALRHEVSDIWPVDGGAVCHGLVTYTRHDGSELSVPFSNVFKMVDGMIGEYLIFADTSQLYA